MHAILSLVVGGIVIAWSYRRIKEIFAEKYSRSEISGLFQPTEIITKRNHWINGRRGDVYRCWFASSAAAAWIVYATVPAIAELLGFTAPAALTYTLTLIAFFLAIAAGYTRYDITEEIARIDEELRA